MVGGDDSVPHCNWVRRCVLDNAFQLAWPRFPLDEGRPPDGRLAGHHRPLEGSKEGHAWVNDDYE